jgi:hypothetical protein
MASSDKQPSNDRMANVRDCHAINRPDIYSHAWKAQEKAYFTDNIYLYNATRIARDQVWIG